MDRSLLLRALPLAMAPAAAFGDTVQVVLRGPYVQSVSAGATTIDAQDLGTGISTGVVDGFKLRDFPPIAADDRNLETYFTRLHLADADKEWRVDLGSWTDSNGVGYDFFVFEIGGDDVLTVAAEFPDGSLGAEITVGGWTATTYVLAAGPKTGQTVHALAFRRDQLLDGSGQPLAEDTELAALVFQSRWIDVATFLVHRPDPTPENDGDGSVTIAGPLRAGKVFELVYDGPFAHETDVFPNPFLDMRLDVVLDAPDGSTLRLPGFFAGDAGRGDEGTVWKARFRPWLPGTYSATASFREGPGIAASLDPLEGAPGLLDGVQVGFDIQPFDPDAPGFERWGKLQATGGHYPRFSNGPVFLRVGLDSPENLFAYAGFDSTTKGNKWGVAFGDLHEFAPHVADWVPGNPQFVSRDRGHDSRGIMGALNYLAGTGINTITCVIMSLGGDGEDVYPFLGPRDDPFEKARYDTSKLEQWNAVFVHAARLGLAFHIYLGETEFDNEHWLDAGTLGPERKVFYRELVARFGHHSAITWDLSEESSFAPDVLLDFATYLQAIDPYDHLITLHNPPDLTSTFTKLLGQTWLDGPSLQFTPELVSDQIEMLRAKSVEAGHTWIVSAVEQRPFDIGLSDTNHHQLRKRVLWDAFLSGAAMVNWYLGTYDPPLGGDLSIEDFRTRRRMWKFSRIALEFMLRLPFEQMVPADELLSGEHALYGGGEVFADPGWIYVVYLPRATGAPVLDLTGTQARFLLRWFNPRSGRYVGRPKMVPGGGPVPLGPPPHAPSRDWIAVLTRPERSHGK